MRTAAYIVVAALGIAPPAFAQHAGAADHARVVAKEHVEVHQRTVVRQRDRRDGERGGREEQVEQFSRTVRIGAEGAIDVSNLSGDVVVTRGGGAEAKIDVVKKARAHTAEEAREMLKLVQVDIAERPGRAEVRTRYPQHERGGPHRNVNVTVNYTIAAPAGTRLTLKSMSGDIAVSDISGEISAESMSGDIRIERAARVLLAKTMSGDVSILDAKSDAGMDVGSMSGDVQLKGVQARHLNANCVSGTLSLTDVQFERVRANSMSGDLIFQGALAKNGRYDLNSHSGNVRLTLDGSTGFQVDAHTFSGSVRSDLPLTNEGSGSERDPKRRRAVRGVHGDGSAVLDLSTFSGNIVIAKR